MIFLIYFAIIDHTHLVTCYDVIIGVWDLPVVISTDGGRFLIKLNLLGFTCRISQVSIMLT